MQNLRANEISIKQLKDRAEALKRRSGKFGNKTINEVALTMAGGY